MRRLALSFALAFFGCLAAVTTAPAQGGSAAPDAAAAAAGEADEIKVWVKQLEDARARLSAANGDVVRLDDAKGRGAARRYPRGDVKEKYIAELQAALVERDAARRAFPQVVEDARRAGVPAGVLSDYEDEADAAVAAADAEPVGAYQPENTDDAEYQATNTDDAESRATNTDDAEYQGANTDDAEARAVNTDDTEYRPANTDDAEESDPSDD